MCLTIACPALAATESTSLQPGSASPRPVCVKAAKVNPDRSTWQVVSVPTTYSFGPAPRRCPDNFVPVAVYRNNMISINTSSVWVSDAVQISATSYRYFGYPNLPYGAVYPDYLLYCAPIIYPWVCT